MRPWETSNSTLACCLCLLHRVNYYKGPARCQRSRSVCLLVHHHHHGTHYLNRSALAAHSPAFTRLALSSRPIHTPCHRASHWPSLQIPTSLHICHTAPSTRTRTPHVRLHPLHTLGRSWIRAASSTRAVTLRFYWYQVRSGRDAGGRAALEQRGVCQTV